MLKVNIDLFFCLPPSTWFLQQTCVLRSYMGEIAVTAQLWRHLTTKAVQQKGEGRFYAAKERNKGG